MSLADRSMGLGLKAINGLAGLDAIDRAGLREPLQCLVYQGSKSGFRTATAAGAADAAEGLRRLRRAAG